MTNLTNGTFESHEYNIGTYVIVKTTEGWTQNNYKNSGWDVHPIFTSIHFGSLDSCNDYLSNIIDSRNIFTIKDTYYCKYYILQCV